ncbi:MAG: ECF transporter S component [Aerococcus sp.]|nr:ECF transporter S component [Aerococcus sp.]
MKNKYNAYYLTVISLIIAILMIQAFVPWLGYLPLGFANVTIVHVTVIIGAILLGVRGGAIIGTSWGILALIRHLVQPTLLSPIFYNPLVAIVPRLCVGVIVAVIYPLLRHYFTPMKSGAIAGVVGSLTNSLLVTLMVYFFARTTYAELMHIPESTVLFAFVAMIIFNAIFECLAAAVLTPLITRPLLAIRTRQEKQ